MAATLKIPEELQRTFQRLVLLLPDELRDDPKLQESLLVFLKFGGEKIARHHIEINRMRHQEKLTLEKMRRREEAIKEALVSASDESDDFEFPTPEESDDPDMDDSESDIED